MKIENQVLSIEQSKHLQELGLDMSDAALCWNRQTKTWDDKEPSEWRKKWSVILNKPLAVMNFENYESIPTYTMQELWEKLPEVITYNCRPYFLFVENNQVAYFSWCGGEIEYTLESLTNDKELTLFYKMLCWVLKNGYYKEETK